MNKVTSFDEAIDFVVDGSHVALTGFAITRNCVAVAHALVRAGRRDLTVSQVIGGVETDVLAAGGCITHLRYSGGSMDRFGPLHGVNRAILAGELTATEYSSLALTLRFHAAALGVPFIPTRSMLGSDVLDPLLATGEVTLGDDPFGHAPAVLLAPLRPDVAFVHVDAADEHGNGTISGPTWAIRETACSARKTIVMCEELVPVGSIDPNRVTIPAAFTTAVAVVPRSAHPTAVHARYDYDRPHLERYAAAARESADAHRAYLDRYVHGVGSHAEYLDLVGQEG